MSDFSLRGLAIGVCAVASNIGCDPAPPPPAAPTPAAPAPPVSKDESASLERLRALNVFTVKEVVAGQPKEMGTCYGPCQPLGQLVDKAEHAVNVVKDPAPAGSCEPAAIAANLAIIESLNVVRLDGLIKGKDPAETCAQAGKLANIAAAAKSVKSLR